MAHGFSPKKQEPQTLQKGPKTTFLSFLGSFVIFVFFGGILVFFWGYLFLVSAFLISSIL